MTPSETKAKRRLSKLVAVLADKGSTAGERTSAGQRIGEILAAHPMLAAGLSKGTSEATAKATSKGKAKRPVVPPVPTPPPPSRGVRKVVRVVRKAGQTFGLNQVAGVAHAALDLLDEWEREP